MSYYFDEGSNVVMRRNVWRRIDREGASKDDTYMIYRTGRSFFVLVVQLIKKYKCLLIITSWFLFRKNKNCLNLRNMIQ